MFSSKLASLKIRLARLNHQAGISIDLKMMEMIKRVINNKISDKIDKLGFALDGEVTEKEIVFGCYPIWAREGGRPYSRFIKPRNPVGTVVFFTLSYVNFDKGEASDMEVTTTVVSNGGNGTETYRDENQIMPSTSVASFILKKFKQLQKSGVVESQPLV